MQICPLCGQHSLESHDGRKFCVRRDCPCNFRVDPQRVAILLIMEEVNSKAESRPISEGPHRGEIGMILDECRRNLVALMEGNPDWPDYQEFLDEAKLAGSFNQ